MTILASKFDVIRGWPTGAAFDETFPVYQPAGVPVSLSSGTLIALRPDGTVDVASSPVAGANSTPVWIVIEGNDDYSGTFLQKVVALTGTCMVKTTKFVAGSWAVGSPVTFDDGQFALATVGLQVVGSVMKDDRTVDGTLTILFTSGLGKATV